MNDLIEKVKNEVSLILSSDKSGHGMNHIERVLSLSYELSKDTEADLFIVSLIALLHDVDDYKIVGIDEANNLFNARRILNNYIDDENIKNIVIEAISTIGYSKRLEGIKPTILEAMIVSDADMLDAMGACGISRSMEYAASKGRKIFDPNIFPSLKLSSNEYKAKDDTTMINHVFEKLLRLKDLILTDNAKEEALIRHDFMVNFLKEYFNELKLDSWLKYLDEYLNIKII